MPETFKSIPIAIGSHGNIHGAAYIMISTPEWVEEIKWKYSTPLGIRVNFKDIHEYIADTQDVITPPFEGGVARRKTLFRFVICCLAGVVDSLPSYYLYFMDNKIIFNRKNIKPFRAYLRSKTTSAEGTF